MVVVSFTDNRQIGERSSHSVLECTYQEQGKPTFSVVLVKILTFAKSSKSVYRAVSKLYQTIIQ